MVGQPFLGRFIGVRISSAEHKSRGSEGYDSFLSRNKKGFDSPTRRSSMITAPVITFLRESNNIEDEWDDKSLEDSILAWLWIIDKQKLTIEDLLDTHEILMDTRDTLETKHKGVFRDGPIWIGGREGVKHYSIENLIQDWLKRVNSVRTEKEMVEDHILYEHIHPFFDGNGRTGRIFLNWQRVRAGLPILIINEKEKQKYYNWF